MVVLDLCVKRYGARNVEAFMMYMVKGLACEMRPVERAVRRYGVELHLVPHWELPNILKRGRFGPVPDDAHRMRSLRSRDIETALRERTGIPFVAYGHREVESLARLAMLRSLRPQGLDLEHWKVYPIWDWKTPSVYAYMKANGIAAPNQLGTDRAGKSGGLSPENPEAMHWLAKHHPDDFAKVERVFPLV